MSYLTRPRIVVLILLLPCLALAGCRRSAVDLAPVEGTVTLDGRPLAGARVEFQPVEGSPSYAITDAMGHYALMYAPDKPGAQIGRHQVRISTWRITASRDGTSITVPEQVPEEYNVRSKLVEEVKPEENVIHFRLLRAETESGEKPAAPPILGNSA